MATISFATKLHSYIKAGYPLLWVRSHEESRVCREIHAVVIAAQDNQQGCTTEFSYYEWNALTMLETRSKEGARSMVKEDAGVMHVVAACAKKGRDNEKVIVVLKDFHNYIDTPLQTRALRNALENLKSRGNMLIIVSPIIKIPVELEKEIQLLDFSLPDEQAISAQLEYIQRTLEVKHKNDVSKHQLDATIKQTAIEAAKGMTVSEIENAFALAIVENKQFNQGFVDSVFGEKIQQVKKGGLLTYINADTDFSKVGGLTGLKKWLKGRSQAYSAKAREFGLPYPKGILLCGLSGCGKTLIAKATAKEFGFPLFQLDVGAMFGRHVGESEENFRKVIDTVDGIGRCILFIDEMEKSLNRDAVSGAGDSGTSSRSFATLLNWFSEHTTPVFVIATSNKFTSLPLELVRKGRFDDCFWIDLPTDKERGEIFKVLLEKYSRDHKKFNIKDLVKRSDKFTGAEIENVIVEGLFAAFTDGTELETCHLVDGCTATRPMAITASAELEALRSAAEGKLRSVNETTELAQVETRKITV